MVHLDPHSHTEFTDFLTEEECLHIADILRRDEHKILAIPNQDKNTFYQGTTKQYSVYNLLTHPDIRPLNIPDRIFTLPMFTPHDELWVQCWGNILHQNQSIGTHTHADSEHQNKLLACSIYLDGKDPTYTHWDGEPQENVRGTLHVAGMLHPHEVKTNIHTQPRISMAFDIYTHYEEPMRDHKRFLHIKRPNQETIVHESEYEGMPIVVKKTDTHTSLYFGHNTWLVQTHILNNNPTELYYPYVQQLCDVVWEHTCKDCYCDEEDLKSALVLGLGGGVIPSWIHKNTKCRNIDVVELIPELTQIAQEHFQMPKDINVINDDAFKWIHRGDKQYDIIILDLANDKTTFKYNDNFYRGLKNRLTKTGICAINYLAHENTPEHATHLNQLRQHFNHVDNVGNHQEKNTITYVSHQTQPSIHTYDAQEDKYKRPKNVWPTHISAKGG